MLSIIIPTYNEEDYLPLLLNSIKSQIYRDYEVIIADNQSTDNTIEIAKAFGATITPGGMPGKSRNIGASFARGDTFLFLDADVILFDQYFLCDVLEEFNDCNAGVATCKIVPLSTRKFDLFIHNVYNWFISLTYRIFPLAPGFCILVKNYVHQSIDGFDESIMLAEDSDYVKRAAKKCKFQVLKSQKIPVSVRRLDRDGRFTICAKYVLSGLYMLFFGKITTNILITLLGIISCLNS